VGDRADMDAELLQPFRRMSAGADHREYDEAVAERLRIEPDRLAADKAVLPHQPDAPPAGGLRQPDLLGQLALRLPGIRLKFTQDPRVDFIERLGHFSINYTITTG